MRTLQHDVHTSNWFSGGLSGFFAALGAQLRRTYAARQSRAATAQLLACDDRLLTDIGVTRGDVEQALSVGWADDPAATLAQIRRQRIEADRKALASHPE